MNFKNKYYTNKSLKRPHNTKINYKRFGQFYIKKTIDTKLKSKILNKLNFTLSPVIFDITPNEYKPAKGYLKSIDMLNTFLNNKTSIDGYSLIAFANAEKIIRAQHNTKRNLNTK